MYTMPYHWHTKINSINRLIRPECAAYFQNGLHKCFVVLLNRWYISRKRNGIVFIIIFRGVLGWWICSTAWESEIWQEFFREKKLCSDRDSVASTRITPWILHLICVFGGLNALIFSYTRKCLMDLLTVFGFIELFPHSQFHRVVWYLEKWLKGWRKSRV